MPNKNDEYIKEIILKSINSMIFDEEYEDLSIIYNNIQLSEEQIYKLSNFIYSYIISNNELWFDDMFEYINNNNLMYTCLEKFNIYNIEWKSLYDILKLLMYNTVVKTIQ